MNTSNQSIEPLALSRRDAAKALGICERTLNDYTQPKGPIPSVKLGERRLYPVDGLREWLTRAAVEQIGEPTDYEDE